MDILKELYQVTNALAEAQIDYAICGGLAVAIHGRPRMTVDIDLLLPADQIAKAAEVVAANGYDDVNGWVVLPRNDFGIDRLYRVNKLEGNEFLTLDLLEADSESNPVFRDRQEFEINGQVITVLSRGSLITMKLNTGRAQDKHDAELLQRDIADESN